MDSDDEGEEEDEEEELEEHAPLPNQGIKSSEKHGDHADAKTSEENRDEVCVESLDEVQSFGRMMLLAPSLQNDLCGGKLEPAVVVAACRALGRAKFFDHELLEALFACLRQLLLADKLDVAQANDALLCLDALNAYDRGVLSALAASFRSKTSTLEPAMRSSWLEVFRRFEHKIEKDFLQMLEVPPLIPANPSYRRVRAGTSLEAAVSLIKCAPSRTIHGHHCHSPTEVLRLVARKAFGDDSESKDVGAWYLRFQVIGMLMNIYI